VSAGIGEGQLAVPPGGGKPWPGWMDVSSAPPLDVGTCRRVLVVRTDHLGDLILSTPFLETLKRSLPRSHVTVLVTPYTRDALSGNPSVDEVRALEPAPDESEPPQSVRKNPYDVVIALSPTMRAYSIARGVKAPVRAGYIYSRRWVPRALSNVLLTHRAVFHIDALVERRETVPHEVEQLLWFARMLGLSAEPVPLRIYPSPDDVAAAGARLEDPTLVAIADASRRAPEWNTVSRRDSSWIAVHLSAAWIRHPWSMGAFAELLKGLLHALPNARVAITCGPQEVEWGRELRETYAGANRVKVVSDMSVCEWAAVLGAARIALSADTGGIHVAAAMRTPVVAAYEQSTYHLCSQQWAPWMVPHRKVCKANPAEAIPEIVREAADLWKPGR